MRARDFLLFTTLRRCVARHLRSRFENIPCMKIMPSNLEAAILGFHRFFLSSNILFLFLFLTDWFLGVPWSPSKIPGEFKQLVNR